MSNEIKELVDQIRDNNRKSGWSDIDKMMDEAAEALENLDAQLDVCIQGDAEVQAEIAGYRALGTLEHLRELVEAERDGRLVVLDVPRKPLLWGDKDRETVLCPYCREDLMGMTYGERKLLQCPVCGQYLDATIVYDPEGAEVALGGVEGE